MEHSKLGDVIKLDIATKGFCRRAILVLCSGLLVLAMTPTLAFAGKCSDDIEYPSADGVTNPCAEIRISEEFFYLWSYDGVDGTVPVFDQPAYRDSHQLSVTLIGEDPGRPCDDKVAYFSMLLCNAVVDHETGLVTKTGSGPANIVIVTSSGVSKTINCTAVTVPSSLALSTESLILESGSFETLASSASSVIVWSSSDTDIATVSDSGLVTALRPGTATITASSTAYGVTASNTCDVTVMGPYGLIGTDRYDTAVKIAEATYATPGGVIIATGEGFADALAASSLAGILDYPIVLTASNALSETTRSYLEDNNSIQEIIVVGGTGAISNEVFQELVTYGNAKRLSGPDRIATADAIFSYVENLSCCDWSSTAIVTDGYKYADALSISPYAVATDSPIFLAQNGALSGEDFLKLSQFENIIIVGGTGAVSSDTESSLKKSVGSSNVKRLGGVDRYETSSLIAEYAVASGVLSYRTVAVTTGQNYPDALAGSIFCGKNEATLILADSAKRYSNGERCVATLGAHVSEVVNIVYLGGSVSEVVKSHMMIRLGWQ